ncbi:peptidase family M1-domain-containing protein [Cubamyces lactineus]|nr:peptidase family M1-domain-containing protein [Cubamyces lactineus]
MTSVHRLPKDVRPKHYDLTVWTDLDSSKFDGVVHIDLHIEKATNTITLNTLDLNLSGVVLRVTITADGTNKSIGMYASGQVITKATQRGIFTFPQHIPAGSDARLTIAFNGVLSNSLSGYYRSMGGQDGTIVYSLTQFQATAARKAFPCWDEPALKATFSTTLVSRVDTVNISNMSVRSEQLLDTPGCVEEGSWLSRKAATLEDISAWKVTRFETTPPMSTYLVAYANGPFKFKEGSYVSRNGQRKPLRIYATEDNIHQGQYAIDLAEKIMPLYEQLFDLDYPLPKLDFLVSSDFDLGGMENWGLIVGRTSAFLYDPEANNLRLQQYVGSLVSHEVAHMWFGDITTMEWWDYLYLNEGFATLVGEKIVLDRVFRSWQLDARFLSSNFYPARYLDAKRSSHPIEVECPDPDKIVQIFDDLSYCKAASVLRMLADYVGEEKFLKGVSIYLNKHKFKNTVTKDLWDGIQAATHLDIPKMMDNWVKKMGYPVITVAEKANGISIRQDRFLETGPVTDPKDNETIWTVPLHILTVDANGSTKIDSISLLEERTRFIALDVNKPFKLNAGTSGFYAVKYEDQRLEKLGKQVTSPNLGFSLQDRIGLIRDAFALTSAGYAPVRGALALLDGLRASEEYLVVDSIAASLTFLTWTWWEDVEITKLLNAYRGKLFATIVKKMGFDPSSKDSPDDRQLRVRAIEQAAEAEVPWIVDQLYGRFEHFRKTKDRSRIISELCGITYRIGVQKGGKEAWAFVKGIAEKPSNPAEGISAMSALGETRDLSLAKNTFSFATQDARAQDVLYYLRGLRSNVKMRRFLAEQVMQHFDELEHRFAGMFIFNYLIETAFASLTSYADHEKLTEFFKGKNTAKYELPLHKSLDEIKMHAKWIGRDTAELRAWLEEHQG